MELLLTANTARIDGWIICPAGSVGPGYLNY